jgi:hypothetical protein
MQAEILEREMGLTSLPRNFKSFRLVFYSKLSVLAAIIAFFRLKDDYNMGNVA